MGLNGIMVPDIIAPDELVAVLTCVHYPGKGSGLKFCDWKWLDGSYTLFAGLLLIGNEWECLEHLSECWSDL